MSLKTLDSELEKLFSPDENGKIQRICSKCGTGHLELKLGKFGPLLAAIIIQTVGIRVRLLLLVKVMTMGRNWMVINCKAQIRSISFRFYLKKGLTGLMSNLAVKR